MKLHKTWLLTFLLSFSFIGINPIEASTQTNFQNDLHKERLSFLKMQGFQPKVIYDIGAFHGNWALEIKQVYSNTNFFLFEANENNTAYLKTTNLPFCIALLGDENKMVTFYTNDSTGDSVLKEQTSYYADGNCQEKQLAMYKLSTIVNHNKMPLPDLIKIDVQGAEQLIIRGSPEIIKHAEVVILETKILEYNKNAPLIFDTMKLMDSLGFRLLDLLECHYLCTGQLNELDLLFVKKDSKLIKQGLLDY